MRNPAVSGQFYPDDKSQLSAEISNCFKSPLGPGSDVSKKPISERTIIGAVSPHAGYMFSGPVAAHLYYALRNQKAPSTVVIVGPNHTGYGAGLAVTTEDFLSPLGIAKTDTKLVEKLVDDLYVVDPSAHAYEHSIEVQIPFMQYIGWDAKIVPICVGVHDYGELHEAGKKLRDAIGDREDVLVIASSDMSHYVPAKVAKDLDGRAIDCILNLDSKKLYETIFARNISMCGFGPTIIMMESVRGSKATLLKYATSGDVHPMRDVVGYASISIEK